MSTPASPSENGGVKRTVRLVQLASFLCATLMSLVCGALFDAYLLVLRGSNEFVGDVETANGVAALAVAFPAGWLSDRWTKRAVIRLNAFLGALGGAVLGAGILKDSVAAIVSGSVVLSMHNQCFFGVSAAFLAELSSAGQERTKVISDNASMSSFGRAAGPALQLLAILMFGGAEWTREELHPVLCLGLLLFAPYVLSLALLPEAPSQAQELLATATGEEEAREGCSPDCESSPAGWKKWLAAVLLELGSLITAVGSGMTFKFWPLFFKGDYGFSPAGVCVMQLVIWLGIALGSKLSPKVARRCGRIQSCVVTHYVGTGLLFLISLGGPAVSIIPLVVLRNAVMNSNVPVVQSLVMDLVPKEHRGKWSGIASLRRMTWSGSAFVGGWLSDSHDYSYAFFITACVHSISGIFLLLVAALRL